MPRGWLHKFKASYRDSLEHWRDSDGTIYRMERWRLRIMTYKPNLEFLASAFDDDPSVKKRGDLFFLASSLLDDCDDLSQAMDTGVKLLELMYGLARLESDLQGRASYGIYASRAPKTTGPRDADTVDALVHVNHGLQQPALRNPIVRELLFAPQNFLQAQSDSKVEEVFRLISRFELDWVNLYRVLEHIQGDVGGDIWRSDWASRRDINRFNHTANSYVTTGDFARHGPKPFQPPSDPLTLEEAQSLILGVVKRWVHSRRSDTA